MQRFPLSTPPPPPTFPLVWDMQSAAATAARTSPDRFVLKPQREGGGNNLYGAAVAAALGPGGMDAGTLAGHILMERVFPPVAPALLVKAGALTVQPAVSELGIYSVWISAPAAGDDGKGVTVVLDEGAGHLLRTKAVGVDEGGVAAGFAVLDSPWLV